MKRMNGAGLFPGLSKDKFTFQISDHLPLWMQMNTDIDGQQLDQIIRSRSMRPPQSSYPTTRR